MGVLRVAPSGIVRWRFRGAPGALDSLQFERPITFLPKDFSFDRHLKAGAQPELFMELPR